MTEEVRRCLTSVEESLVASVVVTKCELELLLFGRVFMGVAGNFILISVGFI